MQHWDHASFRLPRTYKALCEFLHDNRDFREDRLPEWDNPWDNLLLCDGGPINPLDFPDVQVREDPVELSYWSQPIEILPFGWEGGDALHYGWAVLAPELDLDDHPCVSFAPIDGAAAWLGDTTKEALENLLAGSMANWTSWGAERGETSPVERASWAMLCRALDLRPRVGSPDITAGARSPRRLRPVVPPGWRYEPTYDDIGVLAPASAFEPDDAPVDDAPVDGEPVTDEEIVAEARGLITAGYPATALVMLKEASSGPPAMQAMREAYEALGRTLHVERAEMWLRLNTPEDDPGPRRATPRPERSLPPDQADELFNLVDRFLNEP